MPPGKVGVRAFSLYYPDVSHSLEGRPSSPLKLNKEHHIESLNCLFLSARRGLFLLSSELLICPTKAQSADRISSRLFGRTWKPLTQFPWEDPAPYAGLAGVEGAKEPELSRSCSHVACPSQGTGCPSGQPVITPKSHKAASWTLYVPRI